MRKYPGCSPIARPSRSNVFFSQSSMKVARHRLILKPRQQPIPAKHPQRGHPPHPNPLTVENPSHTGCLSHGMSLTRTLTAADWRVAGGARLCLLQARHSPSLGEPLAPLASLSAGQVCPRPGMCVSRTTDLVLGIPEAQPSPEITRQVNDTTASQNHWVTFSWCLRVPR